MRNFARHKLYSIINLGGLAVGLAACLLIFFFVRYELSYDAWLSDAGRVVIVETTFSPPGRAPSRFATSPGLAAAALVTDFPAEIRQAVRVYRDGVPIRVRDRQFNDFVTFVDANFFEVFDLPLAAGLRDEALANNASILVTEEMARKYFGDYPAIGETLTINNAIDYTIVGILEDLPDNTHLDIDLIALFDPQRYIDQPWVAEQWLSVSLYTYLLFASSDARAQVELALPAFLNRRVEMKFASAIEGTRASDLLDLHFVPLLDIHLYGRAQGYAKPSGDINSVLTFVAIAGLILIIACINFINLATARAIQRAREISIRKVVGATRRQLVGRFMGETMGIAAAAMVLGMGLASLLIGPYGDFLGKNLKINLSSDPLLFVTLVGLTLSVGLVSGSYPAAYLSSFRPARMLSTSQPTFKASPHLRNGLVVFQFAISVALIASTAIIYDQTTYARKINPGFNMDNKLVLSGFPAEIGQALRDRMDGLSDVTAASLMSDSIPPHSNNNSLLFPTATPGDDGTFIENVHVDTAFFSLFEIKPIAGRLFSNNFPFDHRIVYGDKTRSVTQSIVVNETFLRKFGFSSPEEAIGQVVWDLIDQEGRLARTTIVGVVPDLHTRSLRFEINATLYYLRRGNDPLLHWLAIDVIPGQMSAALEAINGVWRATVPGRAISASFVDEEIVALYDNDEQRAILFASFALFAVFVACMGLFGLAAFAAENRTKEIGVRKIMGASVLDITRALVWEFSKPVLLASLIAWPVAWYFANDWLNGFHYRIDLASHAYLFLFASAITLVIAWATVGGHTIRVARANPVLALRHH